jgi:hypothetical protein
MAMNTGAAKSPWTGALLAVSAMAIVSVVAVARDWELYSWLWAAGVCVLSGAFSALAQARRNRRLDLMVKQARAMDNDSESEQGPR